jgi:RES domain-containing protein
MRKPHSDPPEVRALFARIEELSPDAVSFRGTIVRSVSVKYATEQDLLSGEGAAIWGGRWNPPGVRAVYGSLDIITATNEAYQQFLKLGFDLSAIRPRVLAGAKVSVSKVLDLTESAIRRKLRFSLSELVEEDWAALQSRGEESWTQAIGRGARSAGFEALKVPSSHRPGGSNLVIFPDRLGARSSLRVLASQDLPGGGSGL